MFCEARLCKRRPDTGIYQVITPFSPKRPPVGPSTGKVAKVTGTFVPYALATRWTLQ
jgi:hypothetical protein